MSNKSKPSVNDQLAQLGELVAWFESDQFSLSEAFEKFEKADLLANSISEEIAVFKNKIAVIKNDFAKTE